jgi:hypothetical protein
MIPVDNDNSNILSVRGDALNDSTLNFNNHVGHGLFLNPKFSINKQLKCTEIFRCNIARTHLSFRTFLAQRDVTVAVVSTHGGTSPILTRRGETLEIAEFYGLQPSLRDGRILGRSPRLESRGKAAATISSRSATVQNVRSRMLRKCVVYHFRLFCLCVGMAL